MKSLVEQLVSDPHNMRVFQQERAIYEVTDLIETAMEQAGVSRTQLAKMLGKSKSWVTQLLDGEGNKTFRTVADILAVLGFELHVSFAQICIGQKSPRDSEQIEVTKSKPKRPRPKAQSTK